MLFVFLICRVLLNNATFFAIFYKQCVGFVQPTWWSTRNFKFSTTGEVLTSQTMELQTVKSVMFPLLSRILSRKKSERTSAQVTLGPPKVCGEFDRPGPESWLFREREREDPHKSWHSRSLAWIACWGVCVSSEIGGRLPTCLYVNRVFQTIASCHLMMTLGIMMGSARDINLRPHTLPIAMIRP